MALGTLDLKGDLVYLLLGDGDYDFFTFLYLLGDFDFLLLGVFSLREVETISGLE